jgi:hypothetical protein
VRMPLLRRARPPSAPPRGRAVTIGRIDAALMVHMRTVGGRAPHAALVEWAVLQGWDPEDLDRCLVRGCHGGSLHVELGEPPCTATRQVVLSRRF